MKAADLMIGDWVLYDGEPNIITEVSEIIQEEATVCFVGNNYMANIDEIKPIPLTAEILKKNGFNQDKFGQFILNEDTGESEHYLCIAPSYDEGMYWWTVNSEPIAKINHLHELQHIFRLCKIKKEIKL